MRILKISSKRLLWNANYTTSWRHCRLQAYIFQQITRYDASVCDHWVVLPKSAPPPGNFVDIMVKLSAASFIKKVKLVAIGAALRPIMGLDETRSFAGWAAWERFLVSNGNRSKAPVENLIHAISIFYKQDSGWQSRVAFLCKGELSDDLYSLFDTRRKRDLGAS